MYYNLLSVGDAEKWRSLTNRIILVGVIVFCVVAYFCLLNDQSIKLVNAMRSKFEWGSSN